MSAAEFEKAKESYQMASAKAAGAWEVLRAAQEAYAALHDSSHAAYAECVRIQNGLKP